jgi:hypothetical membrane protein
MIIPLWYSGILLVAFITFNTSLFIYTRIYPNYSIKRNTISDLGGPEAKTRKFFNPTVFIMGIILLPFPYFVYQALPQTNILSLIGIIIFYFVPVGMLLVGLFPKDKETPHVIAALLCFGGLLITNILLFQPILLSNINFLVLIISIIALVIAVPLLISFSQRDKYEDGEEIEKLLHNLNLWEWIAFILLQIWMFSLYINLLFL